MALLKLARKPEKGFIPAQSNIRTASSIRVVKREQILTQGTATPTQQAETPKHFREYASEIVGRVMHNRDQALTLLGG